MKKNDLAEVKNLDEKAIATRIKTLKGELGNLVLDKNMNKLKDLRSISKKRRDLAQTLTIFRQKQLLRELETKVSKVTEESNPSTQAAQGRASEVTKVKSKNQKKEG